MKTIEETITYKYGEKRVRVRLPKCFCEEVHMRIARRGLSSLFSASVLEPVDIMTIKCVKNEKLLGGCLRTRRGKQELLIHLDHSVVEFMDKHYKFHRAMLVKARTMVMDPPFTGIEAHYLVRGQCGFSMYFNYQAWAEHEGQRLTTPVQGSTPLEALKLAKQEWREYSLARLTA